MIDISNYGYDNQSQLKLSIVSIRSGARREDAEKLQQRPEAVAMRVPGDRKRRIGRKRRVILPRVETM